MHGLRDDWWSGHWSESATGDTGPWVRHLPIAWHMAADPGGALQPPAAPRRPYKHDELIAWWSPLAQLTFYGLGWAHPIRGLARWDQIGRPTDDPVLEVVDRWWGGHLPDFLAWGANHVPGDFGGPDLTQGRQAMPSRGTLFQQYSHRTSEKDWVDVWERPGSNGLHYWFHTASPWTPVDPPDAGAALRGVGRSRALVVDQYQGWYRSLLGTPNGVVDGRSCRVDVVVRPLGWLGTYRQSRETGLWFRGRHSAHLLGNEP